MQRPNRLACTLALAAAVIVGLGACAAGIPKEAFQLSPQSLANRQMQTRRFETGDELMMLQSCSGLLQDLGFSLDEADTSVGVLVGSKDRSAVDAAQVTAAVFLALLTAVSGAPAVMPTDERQKFRASIVTRPVGGAGEHIAVRVTFQRIVWNNQGSITKREGIKDPEIYQDFFEKLSKAVFLEAHDL